jgi:uncharacterized membrane protein
MSDVPVDMIVAAFPDQKAADEALKKLKEAQKKGLIRIDNAAVLTKDANGKVHIKETADMGGGKGAAIGGVAGAAIGLIAGPALLVPIVVGGLIGGLAAKLRDSGFSNKRLASIGESLKPGSSAIIAVVEHVWVKAVEEQLANEATELVVAELKADVADQLEKGHSVAYRAIAADSFSGVSRTAGDDKYVEGSTLVVTGEGAAANQFVATEEGFAVHHVVSTGDTVAEFVAVGTGDPKTKQVAPESTPPAKPESAPAEDKPKTE